MFKLTGKEIIHYVPILQSKLLLNWIYGAGGVCLC